MKSVNPCVSRAALVTDPQGSTTTFAYDAADRLISETYPGGQLRSYSYHANGLRQLETNPKGEITRYHYDDAGQLTSLEYFASATALQNNQPGKTVGFQQQHRTRMNEMRKRKQHGTRMNRQGVIWSEEAPWATGYGLSAKQAASKYGLHVTVAVCNQINDDLAA
ncbi:MAG: hypothetical protein ACK4SX_15500 [Alcanivoracaceae bacterium]